MTSFNLNFLFKGPNFNYSHAGFQYINWGGGHDSFHNTGLELFNFFHFGIFLFIYLIFRLELTFDILLVSGVQESS